MNAGRYPFVPKDSGAIDADLPLIFLLGTVGLKCDFYVYIDALAAGLLELRQQPSRVLLVAPADEE